MSEQENEHWVLPRARKVVALHGEEVAALTQEITDANREYIFELCSRNTREYMRGRCIDTLAEEYAWHKPHADLEEALVLARDEDVELGTVLLVAKRVLESIGSLDRLISQEHVRRKIFWQLLKRSLDCSITRMPQIFARRLGI